MRAKGAILAAAALLLGTTAVAASAHGVGHSPQLPASPTSLATAKVDNATINLGETLGADEYSEAPGATSPSGEPTRPNNDVNTDTATSLERAYQAGCMYYGIQGTAGEVAAIEECMEPDTRATIVTWDEIAAMVNSAFVELQIAPSAITYQPYGDWALINMDFIVYTEPVEQTFNVNLLPGLDVTFIASPVHYTWDFGDGTTLESSRPGTPYPNHDLSHVYTSASDGVTLTLSTVWQGTYQLNNTGPWLPVGSTGLTTSTAGPIEIVAMDVNLVPND